MTEPYKTTLVRIMGEEYPIKSDADSKYLNELARYVEDKIIGITSQKKLPPRLKREVLAALLLADEYFTEKKKNADMEEKLLELAETVEGIVDKEILLGS